MVAKVPGGVRSIGLGLIVLLMGGCSWLNTLPTPSSSMPPAGGLTASNPAPASTAPPLDVTGINGALYDRHGQRRGPAPASPPDGLNVDLNKIKHVIIIYQENRSFDNLFGQFPGANGIPAAAPPQRQFANVGGNPAGDGPAYPTLPQPRITLPKQGDVPDVRFPANLPNQTFRLDDYIAPWSDIPDLSKTGDPVHRFFQCIGQINGGQMDKFVAWATRSWPGEDAVAGLVMGVTDGTLHPTGVLARQYVLCDNFFCSMFGGSGPNHWFLVAASALRWPEALTDPVLNTLPGVMITLDSFQQPDINNSATDGCVTPANWVGGGGWVVNNPQDSIAKWTSARNYPPPQTLPTIGDRLTEKAIDWAWYAMDQDAVLALEALDPTDKSVGQWYIVQPFRYFQNYAKGTPAASQHLKDLLDFEFDLAAAPAWIPPVSYIKLVEPYDEHPASSPLGPSQQKVASLVASIQASPIWKDCVIIIAYDENGGLWDHVAPPVRDAFGPGPRVPCVIVSPFAKNGFVDHHPYETISTLRLIEERFNLTPVNARSAAATPLIHWMTGQPD